MKRIIIILFINLVYIISLMAQYYDSKWLLASPYDGYFDDVCVQVDFSFNPPIMSFRKTPIHFEDNSIAMTGADSNIMFYTNGCDILNGQDEIILNKDSLDLGFAFDYCYGGHLTTQNSIVLPFPGENLFSYFYKDLQLVNEQLISEKVYLVKIKTQNNSILSVTTSPPIHTGNLTTGFLTATKHENLKDWWLIFWEQSSNTYTSILAKGDTILKNLPKISGDTIDKKGDGIGQAVFSPDGSKYAFTNEKQGAFIFDFNKTTGELSNFKRIQLPVTPKLFSLGCAFSSNGRFLYVCGRSEMYQIDTWSNLPDTTVVVVGEYSPFLEQCGGLPVTYFKAQLAPDCRIYISGTNGISCLSVIEHPNLKGKDCIVINGGLAFPTNVYNNQTLPNHPNYSLGTGEVCDNTLLLPVAINEPQINFTKDNMLFYPNPTSDYLNLIFPQDLDVPKEINVFSISGMFSKQIKLHNVVGIDNIIKIDISDLNKGMYFLSWKENNKGGLNTIKVIKE